jgi:tellurite resistance protein TehA-like permease
MTSMLFILVGGIYIVDIILCPNTIEFGYKKLVLRFFASIAILLLFLTNYFYKFYPDEVLYCWWWFFGYCLTSSCFQLYLILDSEKNTIIKDKVKEELIVKDESVKHIATSAKV